MPKETGIIMSGSHPKDILELRKTMTRRTWGLEKINKNPDNWIYLEGSSMVNLGRFTFYNDKEDSVLVIKCPYGHAGDRLWVKETWATDDYHDVLKPSELPQTATIYYIASSGRDLIGIGKIRSPLFMPRWASRITREITEVRAERLQEISFRDCEAEGIYIYEDPWKAKGLSVSQVRMRFARLWDFLNAKRGYGWDFNPWVWPIGFKLLESQ